jgi:hypothetical protein
MRRQRAGQHERRGAHGGADQHAGERGEGDQREHVPEPLERGPEPGAGEQQGGADGRERVARGDREDAEDRRAHRDVREERAERDAGPAADAAQEQAGERDAGRRPQRGDLVADDGEPQAYLGGDVVGRGNDEDLHTRGEIATGLIGRDRHRHGASVRGAPPRGNVA